MNLSLNGKQQIIVDKFSPHSRMESWNVATGCSQLTARALNAFLTRQRWRCSSRPAPGSSWRSSPGWAPSCSSLKIIPVPTFPTLFSPWLIQKPNRSPRFASLPAFLPKDHIIRCCHLCVTFVHSMKTKFENGISDILSRPRGSQMLNCLVGTLRVLGDSKHPQAGQWSCQDIFHPHFPMS